jgi:hypothetical protein
MRTKPRSVVEEAVTIEQDGDPWEPPVREAVRSAREQGRIAVVVVHGWDIPAGEPVDLEALVRSEGVNGQDAERVVDQLVAIAGGA